MTLDQLEMLEAVLKAGSFKAAAKMLHKSQPSISVGIKKIEEEYGVQLFSRQAYRPQLTEQGSLLYKAGLKVLQSLREFECKAKEMASGVEPKVSISLDPLVNLSCLYQSFTQLLNEGTATELVFKEAVLYENEQAVLNGHADLGIGIVSDSQTDLAFEYVSRETLVPCISPAWLQQGDLLPKFFDQVPLIVVDTPLAGDGREYKCKQWLVSSHSQKEQLILAGFGWGRVRQSFLDQNKDKLAQVTNSELPLLHLQLAIFKHKLRPLGPTAQRIWNETIAMHSN